MYHYNIWYQSEIYFKIRMDFKPATWKELGALAILKIVYDTMFFFFYHEEASRIHYGH